VITVPALVSRCPAPGRPGMPSSLAGLSVERILNEPPPAALAYASMQCREAGAVSILGGGTFDVFVWAAYAQRWLFDVKSHHGDTQPGW